MFDGEIFQFVSESGDHVVQFFSSGWDASKAISVLIAALSALASIFVKWRNSGYRLVDRLEECLTGQETKISVARGQLANLLQRPPIEHDQTRTAFDEKSVRKIVRKMEWGFGTAAPNDLVGAVAVSSKQAELARRQAKEHQERQALAHLLLGAKAAARLIDDSARRSAVRSQALEEFDSALRINPRDADALEYSIMMLLELNEPSVALERLKTLIPLRRKEGGAGLGRAHRLEAMAYENLSPPKNRPAYEALRRAVSELPPGMTIDCGLLYEHLAKIAQKLNYPDAPERYLNMAWDCYRKMQNSSEGKKGCQRVSTELTVIENAKPDDANSHSLVLVPTL
ncbi:MAG: hypothetical protein JSR99_00195 [Proteobacteria bacterium]|nr:hypothetical protein [Pseudomonadota bacterium]